MRLGVALVIAGLSAWISGSAFANTVYDVNLSDGGSRSAVGTITTDSTVGALTDSNILGWDLQLTGDGHFFHLQGPPNPDAVIFAGGPGLTATATGLFFDFSGTNSFLYLKDPAGLGSQLCLADTSAALCTAGMVTVVAGGYGGTFSIGTGVQQFASVAATPIPATLPLLVSALGGLGFLGWRRPARTERA